jgi:hypothetical protein
MSNITHVIQYSITSSTGTTSLSGRDTEGPNTEFSAQLQFPVNSNSTPFTLALNAALLQSVFLLANQNCTINTNGTNSTSISLIAGIPRVWGVSQGYGTNPFAGVVNSANLTCNAATQLKYLIGSL